VLKDYSAHLRYSLFLVDFALLPLTFLLAYWLRADLLASFFDKPMEPLRAYSWLIPYMAVFSPVVLYLMHNYKPFRREEIWKVVARGLVATLLLTLLGGSLIFLAQHWLYSRALFSFWMGLYGACIVGSRLFIMTVLRRIRSRGYNFRTIVLVGWGEAAKEIASEIEAHSFWGLRIEGVILGGQERIDGDLPFPVLGRVDDFEEIVKERAIDEVFFTLEDDRRQLERVAKVCAMLGCSLHVIPRKVDDSYRISAERLGSIPLLAYKRVPEARGQLFLKRLIDLMVSAVIMAVFPLIYAVVGLAIKMDSEGPVLYRGLRVGHNRRRFYCYKFRTMVKDADKMISLLEEVNELKGPIRKSSRDPRITRVGRFLRRWSIDEIPQFINVLKGEMSIVGPRPPTPDEVERYSLSDLRKLSMPQGITGLWQVSGRDAIKDFRQRLELDLYYIDHWSLWLDLKIMARTLSAILRGGM